MYKDVCEARGSKKKKILRTKALRGMPKQLEVNDISD